MFFAHLAFPQFTRGEFSFSEHRGHTAVVIFFVLSGYVISHATRQRETRLSDFTVSRIVRIYSVVLPALLLTNLVDLTLPSQDLSYQYHHYLEYLGLFLVFGTDYWFLTETAFSNMPFWSLSYEIPYYVFFACMVYFTGRRRLLLGGAVALLVGPRQWLLFPLWMAGAAVSSWHSQYPVMPVLSRRLNARILFATSLVLLIAFMWTEADMALNFHLLWNWFPPGATSFLRYSDYFPGDYLMGALVALNLLSACYADLRFGLAAPAIVAAAGCSFTLYLTHFPFLRFYAAHLQLAPLPLAAVTFVSVWLLSRVTENQKTNLHLLLRRYLPRQISTCGSDLRDGPTR